MNVYRGEFNDITYGRNNELTYTRLNDGIDCYWNQSSNGNAPIVIHTYGAGIDPSLEDPWYNSQKAATNLDATCIFPVRMSDPIDVFENVYREIWDKGENTENIILTGHSAGGPTALRALATMYEEGNIDSSPPLVVMLDGSFKSCKLTSEEIQILADNEVPIIAYYQLDEQKSYYETLGQNRVNIAIIRDNDCYDHATPCTNFFENKKGLYDYASGTGKLALGANGYNISIWSNGEEKYSNAGNPYNITAVDTRDKIFDFFGISIDTYAIKIQQLKELNSGTLTGLSFSINNSELDANLRNVITNIGTTSYINSYTGNTSSENSLLTVSKIVNLTNSYFSITTDLLLNIANEMKEFTKISPAISSVEKEMEERAVELNNSSITKIDSITNTSTLENHETAEQEESIITTIQVPKTEEISSSKGTESSKQTNTQNHIINQNNNKSNNINTSSNNNPLEQFPEYKEVYSDETKIVYDYNDEYRIVIYKDGDEIIGIEHYYNFESEEIANHALESLKLEYRDNQNIENIIQKGQYVKVLFKEEMYENLTITDIRKQYSQLNEIIKL